MRPKLNIDFFKSSNSKFSHPTVPFPILVIILSMLLSIESERLANENLLSKPLEFRSDDNMLLNFINRRMELFETTSGCSRIRLRFRLSTAPHKKNKRGHCEASIKSVYRARCESHEEVFISDEGPNVSGAMGRPPGRVDGAGLLLRQSHPALNVPE